MGPKFCCLKSLNDGGLKDIIPIDLYKVEVIGICGPSCSGKTTLAKNLEEVLKKQNVPVETVHGDKFWTNNGPDFNEDVLSILKDLPPVFATRQKSTNHPDNIDIDKILSIVRDHKTKLESERRVGVVIVESFFLFHWESAARMCTQMIYLKPNDDEDQNVLLKRKWSRNYSKDCSLEDFRKYWDNCVWPLYQQYGSMENMKFNGQDVLVLDIYESFSNGAESKVCGNVTKILKKLEESAGTKL